MIQAALPLGVKRPELEAVNSLIWYPVEKSVELYSIYTLMAFTGRSYPASYFNDTVPKTELSRPCEAIHQKDYQC
jgi:hypothetical protein